jgi:hypothetical protein
MDCLDIVMGLGQPWPDAAFFAAFSQGSLALVEMALQRGALQHSPAYCQWCNHLGYVSLRGPQRHSQAHCMWEYHCRWEATRISERPLWQRTASEGCLIYAAAQVDQEVAQAVAPDIKRWMKVVHLLLWWWGSLSSTHAATHGGPDPGSDGANSCHLPHVVEKILECAGFDLPKVWRQAEPVAAVIRDRLQFPEHHYVAHAGLAPHEVATSTAKRGLGDTI